MTIEIKPFTGKPGNFNFVSHCKIDQIVNIPVPAGKAAYCPILKRDVNVRVRGDKTICWERDCKNWSFWLFTL